MAFESFADFINMGGHGLYVWLCYGLGLLVITLSVLVPLKQGQILRRVMRRRFQREEMNK